MHDRRNYFLFLTRVFSQTTYSIILMETRYLGALLRAVVIEAKGRVLRP